MEEETINGLIDKQNVFNYVTYHMYLNCHAQEAKETIKPSTTYLKDTRILFC